MTEDANSPGGDAFVGAGYRAWNKVEAFDKHVGGHMSAHNQTLGRDVCWLFGDVLAPLLNFVGGSPKRKEFLREKQVETVVEALSSSDLESGTGLNQELGLSWPGDTRWGSHFKTILNVISLYPSILESLDAIGEVSDWNDTNKAESLTHLMMSFDFFFVAHLMLSIFGITNEINLALQKKKEQDIVNAMTMVDVTKDNLQALRDNGWDGLMEKVTAFMIKHGVEVPDMEAKYVILGRSRYRGSSTMELVVIRQHDDALHWSRSFKVVEANLCGDNYRDQSSSRQLEIRSCRSHFSVHSWSSCPWNSLFTPARANTSGYWILSSSMDFPSFHLQEQKDLYSSGLVQGLAYLVASQFLRIISFYSTQLPGPNYHCREGSKIARLPKPSNVLEVLLINFPQGAVYGCGDLIFSSHMIFTLVFVLTYQKFGTRRCIKQFAWLLAIIQSLLILASRKHYTVDVVVAWYTVNLVVFFIDKKLPELPDRSSGNSHVLLPLSTKDKDINLLAEKSSS
ncbi:hypothetical protein V6N13_013806 [Hibiscus sabdariffa]